MIIIIQYTKSVWGLDSSQHEGMTVTLNRTSKTIVTVTAVTLNRHGHSLAVTAFFLPFCALSLSLSHYCYTRSMRFYTATLYTLVAVVATTASLVSGSWFRNKAQNMRVSVGSSIQKTRNSVSSGDPYNDFKLWLETTCNYQRSTAELQQFFNLFTQACVSAPVLNTEIDAKLNAMMSIAQACSPQGQQQQQNPPPPMDPNFVVHRCAQFNRCNVQIENQLLTDAKLESMQQRKSDGRGSRSTLF